MKQGETEQVDLYYEHIQKLVHGLQIPTTNIFLTTMFLAGLQSYLRFATTKMKCSTLQLHKEAVMLCEEGMTLVEAQSAL